MANLPESATYDAGVYQLELTDPVQGGSTGVSNAPLKNLANRTAWLKSQIDGINNGTIGLALYARLASPTFTGSPAAPTAALGDNTTKLATTAFVQNTLGGVLSKSIAGTGSVTLTAVEAGNGIIELTGALTGNRDVIVPSSPTRPWIIRNATTGAFTVTVKTAAGTGVVVAQGNNAAVFCDGTNVLAGESWAAPLASPALTGNPTAPTPAQFDNDTSLATTAFVQRALGNMRGYRYVTASGDINQNDLGSFLYCAPSSPVSLAVINSGVVSAGAKITIVVADYAGIQPVTLTLATGLFVFFNQITSSSLTLQRGQQIELVGDAGGNWVVVNGSGSAALAAYGYQKLPSGLIIQWGITGSIAPGSSANQVLPVAFPNAALSAVATAAGAGTNGSAAGVGVGLSTTNITVYNWGSVLTYGAGVRWLAIGY